MATFKWHQRRAGRLTKPPRQSPQPKEPGRELSSPKECRKERERLRTHALARAEGFPNQRKLEEHSQKSEYGNVSQKSFGGGRMILAAGRV